MRDDASIRALFCLTSKEQYEEIVFLLVTTTAVFAAVTIAQDPAVGGQRGTWWRRPARWTRNARSPATGPIADMVTKFTDAINKQDAAALQKMVTADAVLIDEEQ